MMTKSKQSGVTLTEMVIVIAIISMLVAFGLPALHLFIESVESNTGGKSMVGCALSCARAIAAKERRSAGVRFQKDSAGNQYMIFIVHDYEKTGLSPGFRAVEGFDPIKLPERLCMMNLFVRTNHGVSSTGAQDVAEEQLREIYLDDSTPANLGPDGKNKYVTDISTFSIVFSPTGKLAIRNVRVRNKDAIYQPNNGVANKVSRDDIFNSPENITSYGVGMFIQDDYAQMGLGAESSRSSFVICDKIRFDKLDAQERFTYLHSLEPVYLNPYTGTIISSDE
ncbi:MAG: prepilin-type N-terminal cleavage/methylation domain-containing protein [Phycisphaerales bacterium]|jgi:prepilin-type N-terminal cleavage/methylation domain-containing protein